MEGLFCLVCASFGFMLGTFAGEKHAWSSMGIFLLFLVVYAIVKIRGN